LGCCATEGQEKEEEEEEEESMDNKPKTITQTGH
jgi:hypothetical protein